MSRRGKEQQEMERLHQLIVGVPQTTLAASTPLGGEISREGPQGRLIMLSAVLQFKGEARSVVQCRSYPTGGLVTTAPKKTYGAVAQNKG